jgi:hypothetical protein
MGNFCWMCERIRPNEAFSGRNHGQHLCRECARLPKSERDQKERLSALWDMLYQSNISRQNIDMAVAWGLEGNAEVAALAQLVVDVGSVHPRKKKRLPYIQRNDPALWHRMLAAGVVEDWPDELLSEERWPGPESPVMLEVQAGPEEQFDDEEEEAPF